MLERLQALERGIAGETYNIGGRSELTNIDVVRAICDILDRLEPSKNFARLISFVPDRPGHDRCSIITCRDCKKISQAPAPFHVIARGWAGPSVVWKCAKPRIHATKTIRRRNAWRG